MCVAVVIYLLIGGLVFKSLELEHEVAVANDYCRSIDKLLRRLDTSQRQKFSSLLDDFVGSDLCRAHFCKVYPIPKTTVSFAAATTCEKVTANKRNVTDAIELSLSKTTDLDSKARVTIREDSCKPSRRRLLAVQDTVTFDIIIKFDLIDDTESTLKLVKTDSFREKMTIRVGNQLGVTVRLVLHCCVDIDISYTNICIDIGHVQIDIVDVDCRCCRFIQLYNYIETKTHTLSHKHAQC
jgi:hypothetical protein